MGLHAVLDFEQRLQIGDMTRFNGEKSFVSPLTASPITTMTVAPGQGVTPIDIFNSSAESRYLDFIFDDWTFDVVTGFNDKIDFEMSGVKVATLTQGQYTLAQLLTHIAARLNAVVGITGTFSASSSDDKITIANDTSAFKLLGKTGVNLAFSILPQIGFVKDSDSASSVLGARVQYAIRKVSLVVGDGSTTKTVVKYVKLYSVAGDCLFSDDQDLITWEPDIMKWVQKGRSSFLNIHREAQEQIIYWLDKEGYTNIYNEKFDKFDIIDHSEVNEWSAFLALSIIMWGISNKTDDVFLKKHFEYKNKYAEARNRAVLRLDINEDAVADSGEQVDIKYGTVVTR